MLFRYLPSPHCDARPVGMEISLLVVHAISLPPHRFGGSYIDDLFLGKLDAAADPFFAEIEGLRVSAHFLIDRHGEITQYVPVMYRAWHAGVSQWQGRERCNDFSVGIELEGDEKTPFEPIQYQRLALLFRQMQQRLPSLRSAAQITGHQHIAPERKWDPGPGFDWDHFHSVLAETVYQEMGPPIVWNRPLIALP
ncbi:MAG: 1,6-anhydro-N-acetylmuramyl-L-alanine amidase AmpD [Magnetococcales bacterium]|nr:1,6-anhydro-N-acetylmuramyl-L-alanine amidase AmpD [Magnetococcales bacterium]